MSQRESHKEQHQVSRLIFTSKCILVADPSDRYAEGIPTQAPIPEEYSYDPVDGEAGKHYQFNFLYRSRSMLLLASLLHVW